MRIGERVKGLRALRGWSQGKLAKAAGLSQTTISDLERGRNDGSKELDLIADALGVATAELRGKRTHGPHANGGGLAGEIIALLGEISDAGLRELLGHAKQMAKTDPRFPPRREG